MDGIASKEPTVIRYGHSIDVSHEPRMHGAGVTVFPVFGSRNGQRLAKACQFHLDSAIHSRNKHPITCALTRNTTLYYMYDANFPAQYLLNIA